VSVELENFSFTFIDEDYAASEKLVKIFICILTIASFLTVNVAQWYSCNTRNPEIAALLICAWSLSNIKIHLGQT
jgi:hypothetical protein